MHKFWHTEQGKKLNNAQIRYGNKRHTPKWKRRKKYRRDEIKRNKKKTRQRERKKPISIKAPANFSLINNTNEVLKYFGNAQKLLKRGENVELDISEVDTLTIDTIALMVSSINRKEFMNGGKVIGNTPKRSDLNKLFTESGFYDHVSLHNTFAKKIRR